MPIAKDFEPFEPTVKRSDAWIETPVGEGEGDGPPPAVESGLFKDRFGKDPNLTLSGQPIFGGGGGTETIGEFPSGFTHVTPLHSTQPPTKPEGRPATILPRQIAEAKGTGSRGDDSKIKREDLPPGKPPRPEPIPVVRIKDLSPEEAARLMREHLAKYPDDKRLVNLPGMLFNWKAGLLRAFAKREALSIEEKRFVAHLYSATPTTTEYVRDFEARGYVRAIGNALRSQTDITNWISTWGGLNREQRHAAMEKAANVIARQLGISSVKLVETKTPSNGEFMMNVTPGRPGTIFIPPDSRAWNEPRGALVGVVEEVLHLRQLRIVKNLRDGKIKPGDPLYRQAILFAINADEKEQMYDRTSVDQPLERAAKYHRRKIVRLLAPRPPRSR